MIMLLQSHLRLTCWMTVVSLCPCGVVFAGGEFDHTATGATNPAPLVHFVIDCGPEIPLPAQDQSPDKDEAKQTRDASRSSKADDLVVEGYRLKLIKGGRFMMGTPLARDHSEYHPDEAPREIYVSDFYLGAVPVTAAEFCVFLNSEGNKGYSEFSARNYSATATIVEKNGVFSPKTAAGNQPAHPVTCQGADQYCRWISKKTGRRVRIPSEIEWEFAARGPELRPWPWGKSSPPSAALTRSPEYRARPLHELRGNRWWYRPYPQVYPPVGSFPQGKTPDGVFDMLGNLPGEWCMTDPERPVPPTFHYDPPVGFCVRGFYKRKLEEKKLNWTAFVPLAGDARVTTHHDSRTWTRGSELSCALLRLALDAEAVEEPGDQR